MTVYIPSPLRSYTGQRSEVPATGRSLGELLSDLDRRHSGLRFRIITEQDTIREHIKIFINDQQAHALNAPLRPDDEVHIICALSGGSLQTDSFKDFVLDQLSGLRGLTCRSMFGGYGLYHGNVFFGIIHKSRLYFKTNPRNRPAYETRGMKPFRPNGKQTLKNYYELPVDVMEDQDQLTAWARRSIGSGSPKVTSLKFSK
jgi:DNA transformation protein